MPEYLELEVSLLDIKPRIWRRFLLTSKASFADLHDAIQVAGPWHDCHLWEFYAGKGRKREMICMPGGEADWSTGKTPPAPEEVRVTDHLHEKGDKCGYIYDMGDSWEHEVKLRKRVELKEKFIGRLLAGERAFTPEEYGEKENKAEFEEYKEWLGDWSPEWDFEQAKKRFDQ